MQKQSANDITGLLLEWRAGDDQALAKIMELVYADLHRAAHRYMAGERPSHTLQTTALIHEVYLRLVGFQRVKWQDQSHFLAVCARLMRRILVDFASSRGYQKRGAAAGRLSLDEAAVVSPEPDPNLVAVDDALKTLAAIDARKSQIIELRFFGGLTVKETAAALNVSAETVMRDWKLAKVWLLREISQGDQDGS